MNLNPAAFAVRRWQFTLVAFGLLIALGVNALMTTPRSEDPQFPTPIYIIQAVMPGAEPADMEQLVAKPVEDVMAGLDNVNEVASTSVDGAATVHLEFDWGVDPERKYDEVLRELNALRPNLPAGIVNLEVRRIRTIEVAFVQTALVSDVLPMRRLEKLADRMRERLERVPGVRKGEYWGAPASEVRVSLNPGRLTELRLPPSAVADALRAAGSDVPIGAIHAGDRRFNVKSGGAFRSLETVKNTPVREVNGQVVRVRDVADVDWAQDEANHLARFDGRRAVFVTAMPKDGVDVTKVTDDVNAALDEFEKTLPAGVKLERAFQQSENIKHRLGSLFRDFGLALALVLVTLLPLASGPAAWSCCRSRFRC